MTAELWMDQALTALVINFCWWLSHENASSKLPLRHLMTASYAALGMLMVSNMVLRAFVELRPLLPWAMLLAKACLVMTLGISALRLTLMEKPSRTDSTKKEES